MTEDTKDFLFSACVRFPLDFQCIVVVVFIIIIIINNNNNNKKEDKYVDLQQTYTFVPLAIETLEPINVKGVEFLQELDRRLVAINDDNRQTSFLFQRISISLQRFHAITFADTFA